jgi:hypothetical protein
MATKSPERQGGTKLPKKEMAIKKKLLLVSAVKRSQQRSLSADDIRVLNVDFRVPTSGLLKASQIVIGNSDYQDGVSILDSDPDDQIRRIDTDPTDGL